MPDPSETRDAWLRLHELMAEFTREWEVRADIEVIAWATDRNVELKIGERREDHEGPLDKFQWQTTGQRNVSTMRELAHVLLAACDFVDASNPEWSKNGGGFNAPEKFEVRDD